MILIALGSNLDSQLFGTPEENCKGAITLLKKHFLIKSISSFYKTEPIPKSSQPWFVNGIIRINTDLPPNEILNILLEIEKKVGRKRINKNEARTIDLDLICYNDLVIKSKKLTLPHPRMHLRAFVMRPLCDIDKNWIHPTLNKKAWEILKELANHKINNIN